ncbi:MAG TPA: COX15/CtaA family protein [Chryseosolibacter sp.]
MNPLRSFYRLTLSTLVAVYFLILVGGVVRSTGSGMGCPDWPKCFGSWVPPSSANELPSNYKEMYSEYRQKKNVKFAKYLRVIGLDATADKILNDKSVLVEADFNATKTWIEYLNRVVGVIIGFLIFAVFISSLKFRKTEPRITVMALATFLMVGFQGWIGSFVVSTNLTPWTITVHMLLALVIVAMLVYLTHVVSETKQPVVSPIGFWLLIGCMTALLVQIVLGTQVREAIDSVAAIAARHEWIGKIHGDLFIHRSFSWIVTILHLILLWKLGKTTGLKTFPVGLILLILGTILTGAGMAYFNVPPFLQPVHLLLATVTFGVQFMLLLKLKSSVKPILATQR